MYFNWFTTAFIMYGLALSWENLTGGLFLNFLIGTILDFPAKTLAMILVLIVVVFTSCNVLKIIVNLYEVNIAMIIYFILLFIFTLYSIFKVSNAIIMDIILLFIFTLYSILKASIIIIIHSYH